MPAMGVPSPSEPGFLGGEPRPAVGHPADVITLTEDWLTSVDVSGLIPSTVITLARATGSRPVGLPLLEALLSVELLPADISVSLLPVLPVTLLLLLVAFSALHLRLLVMGGEGAGLGRMRMWAGRVVFTLMFSVLLFILVLPPLPALAIVGR